MKRPAQIALEARHLGITVRANSLAESQKRHKRASQPLERAAKLADKLYELTGDIRWKDTASAQRRKAARVKTRAERKPVYT